MGKCHLRSGRPPSSHPCDVLFEEGSSVPAHLRLRHSKQSCLPKIGQYGFPCWSVKAPKYPAILYPTLPHHSTQALLARDALCPSGVTYPAESSQSRVCGAGNKPLYRPRVHPGARATQGVRIKIETNNIEGFIWALVHSKQTSYGR